MRINLPRYASTPAQPTPPSQAGRRGGDESGKGWRYLTRSIGRLGVTWYKLLRLQS
jgi:hypothetical protein